MAQQAAVGFVERLESRSADFEVQRPMTPRSPARAHRVTAGELLVALACFLFLSAAALSYPVRLVEQDAYAYRASIVALSHGHVTLSDGQYRELHRRLVESDGGQGPGIGQWVRLSDGRWVSEKNPGYPFFAVLFQTLGLLSFAPLFYGALGCVGLFLGGRRWLGRWGGTWAVGLFCSSGAALLFAWRDTMPTFTESSLLAAGTGALLWALLAGEAGGRRRTIVGLLAFLALEGAVFVRYTDIVVLGCGLVVVLLVRWLVPRTLPRRALLWWVGSVLVFGALVLVFDRVVYGDAFSTGYAPGVITFGLGALAGNLAHMPLHLTKAMPAFWLALVGIVSIAARELRLRRSVRDGRLRGSALVGSLSGSTLDGRLRGSARDGRRSAALVLADRDLAIGAGLAASWFGLWGLYALYYWTAQTSAGAGSTLQVVRFFVPALAPIALLAAWLLARVPRRLAGAALVACFALGFWSFTAVRTSGFVTSGGLPPAPSLSRGAGGGASPLPGARGTAPASPGAGSEVAGGTGAAGTAVAVGSGAAGAPPAASGQQSPGQAAGASPP